MINLKYIYFFKIKTAQKGTVCFLLYFKQSITVNCINYRSLFEVNI